jgi:hypothetical protein
VEKETRFLFFLVPDETLLPQQKPLFPVAGNLLEI